MTQKLVIFKQRNLVVCEFDSQHSKQNLRVTFGAWLDPMSECRTMGTPMNDMERNNSAGDET